MKRLKRLPVLLIAVLMCFLQACDKNNNLSLFSVQNDVELGQQVSQEIANNPQEFPVLSESQYPEAYTYLEGILDEILASDEVAYKEEFAWEIKIIQDDDVLNAFATPGGYIYIYTGLIKYLDSEDDLAGVLGHEIAHADLRHTSRQLQRQYGISILLSVALGQDPGTLEQIAAQIAGGLAGLRFSREFEEEADSRSVDYLADTDYACNSAASFFEKLLAEEQNSGTPEFLSTHPSPDNRVADINAKAEDINCDTTPLNPSSYDNFKNMLP
ncbi:M48 family metalloprotease [Roseivirga sp. BDSF3-8]|uniref:M48 family metalloprotease n=1 Tax=Roseivirga sp. BDSF3-8 TaxID=3241598 RepID=UPI003531A643